MLLLVNIIRFRYTGLWLAICILIVFLCSSSTGEREDEGYIVLSAFTRAYHGQIKELDYNAELQDWTVKVNGELFHWAGGRLLPSNEAPSYQKYRKYSLYYYPVELPPLPFFRPDEERKFLESIRAGRNKTLADSDAFRKALFNAPDRKSMNKQLRQISFMNFNIKVHRIVIQPLKRVEQRLKTLLSNSKTLRTFWSQIANLSSFSWRKIQYFEKLSNHSFGTALDFKPISWRNKAVYWLWSKEFREDWFNYSYLNRWNPPHEFIEAFEAEGFIWGGKWLYFDAMHFEYRPELFLLRDYLQDKKAD